MWSFSNSRFCFRMKIKKYQVWHVIHSRPFLQEKKAIAGEFLCKFYALVIDSDWKQGDQKPGCQRSNYSSGFPCHNLSFLCTSFHWKCPPLTTRKTEDKSLAGGIYYVKSLDVKISYKVKFSKTALLQDFWSVASHKHDQNNIGRWDLWVVECCEVNQVIRTTIK